jgi:hypothetical protein
MQLTSLVRLVQAVWQFFQGTGEEIMIPVWTPQERSVTVGFTPAISDAYSESRRYPRGLVVPSGAPHPPHTRPHDARGHSPSGSVPYSGE